jgi:hypothetical protein
VYRKWAVFVGWGSLLCVAIWVHAQSFTLSSGETITGEPFHFDNNGVVFKHPDGRTSARVPWTNFPETVLKQFADNPKAKSFVAPYLDVPEEDTAPKKVIQVKQPERLERPVAKSMFGALFSSPLSIVLLGLAYVANLYAALEIASFRGRPVSLVCGLAAVVPFVTPVLFLCLPGSRGEVEAPVEPTPAPASAPTHAPAAAAPAYVPPARPAPAQHRPIPLSGAATHQEEQEPAAEPPPPARPPAGPKIPAPVLYTRGQTMFNRRFFETKLAGFLRMVPSDAEKDMIILIKSSRGEFVGNRISKLQQDDLVLQFHKGTASADVTIPFMEIQEVQIRHKDS